ncbi:transcription factor Adf-1-like, partial [Clarias magur]
MKEQFTAGQKGDDQKSGSVRKEKELRKKWDSLRTQYSRYTKMMYGSDGRFFTPRQQWIMQRLKFLDPHIKRRNNYCTDLDYE